MWPTLSFDQAQSASLRHAKLGFLTPLRTILQAREKRWLKLLLEHYDALSDAC